MKTICIVTGTRAEYGLLKPVIMKILDDNELCLKLVVTGMHLCPEFGCTYQEIVNDGFDIDEKIEMVISSDTKSSMVKSTGLAMISFAEYFTRKSTDMVVILGDRYEMFAVAYAAASLQIPIAHISGGDTTEGAIDEFIRHSITKMSYLHFTTTKVYKRRVEQLGEQAERVYNFGSTGVENIKNLKLMSIAELEDSIQFKLGNNYAVVTFHPVTMENYSSKNQFEELLKALDYFTDMRFIFTKANSDAEGRIINNMIDDFVSKRNNVIAFVSMGTVRYLSALKYSAMVIGNSSSGICEAPSFHVPTINIGDRQKGREQSGSIINCRPEFQEIVNSIRLAGTDSFLEKVKNSKNPYEGEYASRNIVETIKNYLLENKINLKKKFNDINTNPTK